VENQKQVSHFPIPPRDDDSGFHFSKIKTKTTAFGRYGCNFAASRIEPSRSSSPSRKGNPPASNASLFQDHLALETKVDFRIILRLENAVNSLNAA